MNEVLFFLHLLLIFSFALFALKLGKIFLTTWIAIQAILANLFVIKQICFFHFNITCSDAFAIGSVLGLNLLQEYYDKQSAKKALWAAFFAMFFFSIMSQMHLLYTNFGFIEEEAIQIDVGPLSHDATIQNPQKMRQEIIRITTSLKNWLAEKSPDLLLFLEQQLQERLS